MKKIVRIGLIGLVSVIVLAACSKKTSQKPVTSEQTKTQQTANSTRLEQKETTATPPAPKNQTTSASFTKEQTRTSTPSRNVPDSLLPYSDAQIEYARVWLAVLGSDYINYLYEPEFNFELNVRSIPAGSLINNYAEGTATYPVDIISLSGSASFQGGVTYASNYNGTVTVYPTPMHWQYSEEQSNDPKFLQEASQWILDNTEVVNVPAGNPVSVKRLIDVMNVNF